MRREILRAGLRTDSAKVGIHTIRGFCGNDPGDLKWLGDKADSRIAPENCGLLFPTKVDPGAGAGGAQFRSFARP